MAKEVKPEIIAQNEQMTLFKVKKTQYVYIGKRGDSDNDYITRVTTSHTPIGWRETECLKFKYYYYMTFTSDFIIGIKKAVGVKNETKYYTNWEYDQDKVQRLIQAASPYDLSEFSTPYNSRFVSVYGEPDKIGTYNFRNETQSCELFKLEEGEKVVTLSPMEKRKEKNDNTYNLINTLMKAQIEAIEEKYGVKLWQVRQDNEIVMNVSWRSGKNVLTDLVKEFVENNILKELGELGLTGKFAGDVNINGDLIKGIKFKEELTTKQTDDDTTSTTD